MLTWKYQINVELQRLRVTRFLEWCGYVSECGVCSQPAKQFKIVRNAHVNVIPNWAPSPLFSLGGGETFKRNEHGNI